MKRCSACGETKPFDAFHRRQKSKDGLTVVCKACKRLYDLNRQTQEGDRLAENRRLAYAANPEPAKARATTWRATNPDRKRELQAGYRQRHREDLRRRHQVYRETHATHLTEAARLYEQTPQRKAWRQAYAAKRWAATRGAVGAEQIDLEALFERYGPNCHICGVAITGQWHADHVVPVTRGGEHAESNLRPAHPYCNRGKSARLLSEIDPREIERWRGRALSETA